MKTVKRRKIFFRNLLKWQLGKFLLMHVNGMAIHKNKQITTKKNFSIDKVS